mmetsp:Transcript_10549/g.32274  ORF Transcript_10549/g.32274 Transcript_10549/m.32274 type:complete len:206 (-) Transcript_10549:634-1251(-)
MKHLPPQVLHRILPRPTQSEQKMVYSPDTTVPFPVHASHASKPVLRHAEQSFMTGSSSAADLFPVSVEALVRHSASLRRLVDEMKLITNAWLITVFPNLEARTPHSPQDPTRTCSTARASDNSSLGSTVARAANVCRCVQPPPRRDGEPARLRGAKEMGARDKSLPTDESFPVGATLLAGLVEAVLFEVQRLSLRRLLSCASLNS